jgi:hypothetical protein
VNSFRKLEESNTVSNAFVPCPCHETRWQIENHFLSRTATGDDTWTHNSRLNKFIPLYRSLMLLLVTISFLFPTLFGWNVDILCNYYPNTINFHLSVQIFQSYKPETYYYNLLPWMIEPQVHSNAVACQSKYSQCNCWFSPLEGPQLYLEMWRCGNIILSTDFLIIINWLLVTFHSQLSVSLPSLALKSANKIFIWYLGNLSRKRSSS